MVKTGLRLSKRKMRSHIPQLLGLVLLLMVGVCFFITLFTIVQRYEETAEQYFIDNAYADVTFYGAFNDENVDALTRQPGVAAAQGRTVRDFRTGDLIIRAISLTDDINIPHIYEGRLPENETECVLLNRNARVMGLIIGDRLTIEGKTLTITALAASPEYIYMVQNERTMMAQPDRFAVVFVEKGFYQNNYNEIVALTENGFVAAESGTAIGAYGFSATESGAAIGAFRLILQKEQTNHYLYRNDLEEISSFAYIFPFIFAVLIAAVIYVMLSRAIQKDKRQIGTMKALGMTDRGIIGVYLLQFCTAALAGAVLGVLATIFICDFIIAIFSAMFEVPTLGFTFYPALWMGAAIVSVLLSAAAGMIALLRILPLLPAHAMRPRIPKGGKQILLERVSFIRKRLSFNSRYALKNALRNKGRFFAVVLGMCGSCALLSFSLGFYDSIGNTQDEYFDGFANYDVIISIEPLPFNTPHPVLEKINDNYKALVLPIQVNDESYMAAIVEQGFDMVNIPTAALHEGVILPEYFARLWKVGVGDTLKIDSRDVIVSAITPQHLGLTLYTSFDYISTVADNFPPLYNTIYGRGGNMADLTAFLKDSNIEFTTIADDNTSFDSIMESMSVLIWFMIACAVVLGFTVLYSIGLINLSAREYEYMFMGVMGYPHKNIMSAHIKETLLQLALAVPLGFLGGNIILESIKSEFSGSSFVISAAIFPQSYAISAFAVVGVTAIMAMVTSRHIGRLDIVEGLKAQDE